MAQWHPSQMRLYDTRARRLYINEEERLRFLRAADTQPPHIQSFCYTLTYTGCRISEALELTVASLQAAARLITFRTLKRRNESIMREVPVPPALLETLDAHLVLHRPPLSQLIWQHKGRSVCRTTAYRWIKDTMAKADIVGAQACPKGLRHGYGIAAIRSGVQLNMLQKWMGHASMETTAIYASALGADELIVAERMWRADAPLNQE